MFVYHTVVSGYTTLSLKIIIGFEMPDKDSQTDLVNTKFSSLVRDQKMWVKGKKERSLCHVKLISYEGLDIKNELEKYSSTL